MNPTQITNSPLVVRCIPICLRRRKTKITLVKLRHGVHSLGGRGPLHIGQCSYAGICITLTFYARIIFAIPFGSLGYSATLAPKVALYTTLACRVHKPELVANLHDLSLPLINDLATTNANLLDPLIETAANPGSIFLPNSAYTALSDYTQSEPDPEQKCASDPVVQATVAKLTAGLHRILYF